MSFTFLSEIGLGRLLYSEGHLIPLNKKVRASRDCLFLGKSGWRPLLIFPILNVKGNVFLITPRATKCIRSAGTQFTKSKNPFRR